MTRIERYTEEQLREEMVPAEIHESGRRDVEALRQPQDATTGAAAIYGKWPGDESEEELLAALDDNE